MTDRNADVFGDLLAARYPIGDYRHAACPPASNLTLVRVITRSGQEQVKVQCRGCGRVSGAVGKGHLTGVDIAALPVLRDNRDGRRCERCGRTDGVELHHYAPRALFGFNDSERHATGWLCPPCHRRWHDIISGRIRGDLDSPPDWSLILGGGPVTDRTADTLTALLARVADDEELAWLPATTRRVAVALADALDEEGIALVRNGTVALDEDLDDDDLGPIRTRNRVPIQAWLDEQHRPSAVSLDDLDRRCDSQWDRDDP